MMAAYKKVLFWPRGAQATVLLAYGTSQAHWPEISSRQNSGQLHLRKAEGHLVVDLCIAFTEALTSAVICVSDGVQLLSFSFLLADNAISMIS